MAKTQLKLFGFERLSKILHPTSWEKRLEKNVKVATRRNGLLAARKVKRDISSRKVQPSKLSQLTVSMKGSSKALVDTGELRKSIVSDLIAWHTVVVGVLKRRTLTDEQGNAYDIMDIAIAMHFGADIPVSDKMRRYFYWLANSPESSLQGKIMPLSPGTTMIHVPGRPFMKGIFDPEMRKQYKRNWQKAINKTIAGK